MTTPNDILRTIADDKIDFVDLRFTASRSRRRAMASWCRGSPLRWVFRRPTPRCSTGPSKGLHGRPAGLLRAAPPRGEPGPQDSHPLFERFAI